MSDAVNLTNWSIFGVKKYYMLRGLADNHPKLGRNVFISHTSDIVDFKIENYIAVVQTASRVYHCPLKFLDTYDCLDHNIGFIIGDMQKIFNYVKYTERVENLEKENKEFNIEELGFSKEDIVDFLVIDDLISQGKKELERLNKENERHLINEAEKYKNSLYIEMFNIDEGSKGAYNIKGKQGIVKPSLHVGLFQDSVLYMVPDILDFRYFPGRVEDGEIYNWSEGLENIVIKNMTNRDIIFNNQTILINETILLNKSNYSCGLISPDVVTGNSLLKGKK